MAEASRAPETVFARVIMSLAALMPAVATPLWDEIFNSLPIPVFLKNSDQELIAVSDKFCELVEASRNQILGFQDFEICPGEHLFDSTIEQRTLTTGVDRTYNRRWSIEAATNGKSERCLRIHLARSVNAHGESYLVGSIEDMTELNEANLSLEMAEQQS